MGKEPLGEVLRVMPQRAVRQRAKLDKTGNTYSGVGDYTYFDPSGNVVLTGPFTITATRTQAEAPAAQ